MKKIRIFIIALLMIMTFIIGQTKCFAASEKINVYLFRGEGCPHCEEAIEWFEGTLAEDPEYSEYYELVKLEVWYDEDNDNLMKEVATELGTTASGVPFIVIGDKYFSGFSLTASPDKIKEAIKAQYNNENYQDIVNAVRTGAEIKDEKDKSSILPIIIISSVTVVAVLGLVFFTKEK